jgi:hypothetical protein
MKVEMFNSMLLADNVVAVTSQMHYAAIYFSRSWYCCKMVPASAKSSVGKMVNYYFTSLPNLSMVLAYAYQAPGITSSQNSNE